MRARSCWWSIRWGYTVFLPINIVKLEALYAKYGSKGLVVLGFPSNDFGKQEPEIADFYNTYGVKFPSPSSPAPIRTRCTWI